MSNKVSEFTHKLNSLLVEYDAEISYSIEDDGMHVTVDGETRHVGFIHGRLEHPEGEGE